ncbi:MAG: hypothetical protein ACK559_35075, partial [bacterium]
MAAQRPETQTSAGRQQQQQRAHGGEGPQPERAQSPLPRGQPQLRDQRPDRPERHQESEGQQGGNRPERRPIGAARRPQRADQEPRQRQGRQQQGRQQWLPPE